MRFSLNTFRYELGGLQRVQGYQIQRLTMELAALTEQCDAQREVVAGLDDRICEQEERLTQLFKEQPMFWIEARDLSRPYLAALKFERERQQREMAELAVALDRLMGEMLEARKAELLLEQHRRRRLDIHRRSEERAEGQLMDELMLRNRGCNSPLSRFAGEGSGERGSGVDDFTAAALSPTPPHELLKYRMMPISTSPSLKKEGQGGFEMFALSRTPQIPLNPPFAKGEVPLQSLSTSLVHGPYGGSPGKEATHEPRSEQPLPSPVGGGEGGSTGTIRPNNERPESLPQSGRGALCAVAGEKGSS